MRQLMDIEHAAPDWLGEFVYGLPELHREALREARYASGVGCNATATTLAVWALVKAGLLQDDQPIIVDAKVGSSEAGKSPNRLQSSSSAGWRGATIPIDGTSP